MSSSVHDFKLTLIQPMPRIQAPYLVESLGSYDLKVAPEEIWPFLIDTSRMNREMGLPPWKETTIDGELHVESPVLGRTQKWIEKSWVWQEPRELQNHRIFSQGWMTEQRGAFTVTPLTNGCRVNIYFQWGFKSFVAEKLFSAGAKALQKKFQEFFKKKEADILLRKPQAVVVNEGAQAKLTEIKNSLTAKNLWTESMRPLLEYFLTGDPMDLDRIQPKKISSQLKISYEDVLDFLYVLIEEGYVYLTWDVICPHCRGTTVSEKKLEKLTASNYCAACEADFGLDQQESIEIVFRLTPKLREIVKLQYCAAAPSKKKHIKLLQALPEDGEKSYDLHLKPGRYRLRGREEKDNLLFDVVSEGGEKFLRWPMDPVPASLQINTDFELRVFNPAGIQDYFVLEESWWHNDRILPGEILSMPKFRHLFSGDHLSSGVQLAMGNQVLLFTDIVGSTPLYRELGDAKAFGAVQAHYLKVTEIIEACEGAIVKYIGDAVMAAFLDIKKAFTAAVKIQEAFNSDSDSQVKLRISLHHGPVLCANLNVGLDYFGTTVNTSAKIQKWAGAHQIAVTKEFWEKVGGSPDLTPEFKTDEKLGVDVVILSPRA